MQNKLLYALWGVLFIICAALGFMPDVSRAMTIVSVLFFVPPLAILARKETASVKLVCWLSGLSLASTVVLLVANVLSVAASEAVGTWLYYLLTVVSAPMICSGHWAMSLFLWACLLVAGMGILRKKPNNFKK